ASVIWGDFGPLHEFNQALAAAPMWAWVVGLLAYAYVASVLPVWSLLQPRDYINALQLISALVLIVAGLVAAATIGGAPDLLDAGSERTLVREGPGDASAGGLERVHHRGAEDAEGDQERSEVADAGSERSEGPDEASGAAPGSIDDAR